MRDRILDTNFSGATLDHLKRDPVDHARTTRQHAGESLKDAINAPGLAGVAAAVIALVVGLFALASGHVVVGCVSVLVAAVLGVAGAAWVLRAHRTVRNAEARWDAMNSERPASPPGS